MIDCRIAWLFIHSYSSVRSGKEPLLPVYYELWWIRSRNVITKHLAMMLARCGSNWSYVLNLLKCSFCRCGNLLVWTKSSDQSTLVQLRTRTPHVIWLRPCHFWMELSTAHSHCSAERAEGHARWSKCSKQSANEYCYVLPTWKRSAYLNLDKVDLVFTRGRQAGSVHDFLWVTTISCAKIEPWCLPFK